MTKKIMIFLIIFSILCFSSIWAGERISASIEKDLNGLKYYLIRSNTYYGPVNIHAIEIDPKLYKIRLAMANNKIGYVDYLSNIIKYNLDALAGINGTFFTLNYPPLPISNIMINGEMVYLNNIHRTNCGITKDNQIFFDIPNIKGFISDENHEKLFYIWGMNRPRKINEVIAYTKDWGNKTETNLSGVEIIVENNQIIKIANGNNIIPQNGFVISIHGTSKKILQYLKIGQKINLKFTFENEWKGAYQIFTGGPRLLENGKIVVEKAIKDERFKGYLLDLNPRTAVGLTRDGKFLMVVVDGRSRSSVGATFLGLAYIMSDLGAIEAMGLDGGNSSIMWINGGVANCPSGSGRNVSNAIIVEKIEK